MDDKFKYSLVDYETNFSTASYAAVVQKLTGTAEDITVSFYLPPNYVEVSVFGELRDKALVPVVDARIFTRTCSSFTVCNAPEEEQFHFQAYLDTSFTSSSHRRLQPGSRAWT